MSTIIGTLGDDQTLFGTLGDDDINGLRGDDVIHGRYGDDVIKGGSGSDVLIGGFGADTFQWSAGHITDGAVDHIVDFRFSQGDTLNFLDSANGDFEVLSITHEHRGETEANGQNLYNASNREDIVFTVRNSETGATQEIVIMDNYHPSWSYKWDDYLATLGLKFDDAEPEPCEVEHSVELSIDDVSPGAGVCIDEAPIG